MSQHTITATRSGSYNGMDYDAEYLITFDYVAGAPDQYDPSIGGPGGWSPGWSAEVSLVNIEPRPDYPPAADDLWEWAKDWIEENRAECIDIAESDLAPDPDRAYDAMRDDEMTGHARHDSGEEW